MAEPQNQAIRDLTSMTPAIERRRSVAPKTEEFLAKPRKSPKGFIGAEELLPVMGELRQQEAAVQTRLGESEIAIEEAKRAEKAREAEMKGELIRRQARETAELPEAQQLKTKREEFANAAFVPTRDNVQDLATMFSLMGVIGMAIGGGGRGASLQAMNAMNGMVEGYRRGRADLYKQQLGEFDRNIKTMQQQIATLEKQYSEAMRLKAVDREAGELEIQRLLAMSDSPVLKAMRARQGDVATQNLIRNLSRDVQTLATLENNVVAKANEAAAKVAAETARAAERAESRELQDIVILQTPSGPKTVKKSELERAEGKDLQEATVGRAAPKAGPKAPANIQKAVESNAVFLGTIDGLIERGEKVKEASTRAIGPVAGSMPYTIAQAYTSQEERDFIQEFMSLTNKTIKNQSGATVTVQEFARQRGVLPLRTDTPEVLLDKLRNLKRMIANETAVYARAYPEEVNRYRIVLEVPSKTSDLVQGMTYRDKQGRTGVWDGKSFVLEEED